MSAGIYDYEFLLLRLVEHTSQSVLDGQEMQVDPTHRLSQLRSNHAYLAPLVKYLIVHFQAPLEVGVGVGYASCEEHLIIIMLEGIAERQYKSTGFRHSLALPQRSLVPIIHTISPRFPLASLFSTANIWSHSSLVERIHLLKTIYVEGNSTFAVV